MPRGIAYGLYYSSNNNNPVILAKKVGKLAFVMRSAHAPLKNSAHALSDEVRRQFDVGGDPKWARLAPSTIVRKKGDYRPLIRTGKLQRKASAYNRWEITKNSAKYTLPPDVSYGYFHQKGFTHLPNTWVPARPFAVVSPKQEIMVNYEFDRWITERERRIFK